MVEDGEYLNFTFNFAEPLNALQHLICKFGAWGSNAAQEITYASFQLQFDVDCLDERVWSVFSDLGID